MVSGLIGKKVNMSRVFKEDGTVVPVTILAIGGNKVSQVKTKERDGYKAVQLTLEAGSKKPNRAEFVNWEDDKSTRLSVGREIRIDEVFKVGDKVQAIGISKGKGFAGVVKRYSFAGGPKTHGQSDRLRAPGSIGAGTDPGRVWKGQKMPGRMGRDKVTVKGLEVVEIDSKSGLLKVKGAVPGARNSIVVLKKTL